MSSRNLATKCPQWPPRHATKVAGAMYSFQVIMNPAPMQESMPSSRDPKGIS